MLTEILSRQADDQILWTFESGDVDIRQMLKDIEFAQAGQFRDKRVFIDFLDIRKTVTALLALDGSAQSFLISPRALETKTRCHLIEQFRPQIHLSDYVGGAVPRVMDACAEIPCCDASAISTRRATQWVLSTSGTTGIPKLVSHTLRSLSRTAKARSSLGHVWGLLYDIASFAGLQVFLNALFSGSKLIIPPMELPLEMKIQMLIEHGCNSLSATPSLWRIILMSNVGSRLKMQQITLGGEIADQNILLALRHTYRDARIVHIFASTEAGVGFSVQDGLAGFPAEYINSSPNGVAIKIDESGRLYLRPPFKEQSYLDNKARLVDEDGFIDTGDIVRFSDNRFVFMGRNNGCINVGGMKVHPSEVESVAYDFPGVKFAKVYARRSHFMGSVVAMDVVIDEKVEDVQAFKEQMLIYFKKHLQDFKVPASIHIVDHVLIGESGKINRVNL